jgi:hypothetical protein
VTVATRADWIIWLYQVTRTPASPKVRWKCGVHGGKVEQGLVDVEHLHTAHVDLLALPDPVACCPSSEVGNRKGP